MPDPALVNARIAELMALHDRWWAEPEAVAEAMSLWGAGANEHGVFCTHERIEMAKTPFGHAAVLIAESGNGLFAYGLEYGTSMGGGGGFPSIWREAFGSSDEARSAAVAELIERLGHGSDKRQVELLRKVRQNGSQRMLF